MDSANTTTAITSLNRKGGVGKTHFCWLMASACHAAGLRILIVDLDPQANLTGSFLAEDDVTRSVEQLFDPSTEPDVESLIVSTEFEGVDLLPSSSRLEPLNISDNWHDSDLHLSLAEALHQVSNRYDYILFDCPPSLSLVSYAALCASQHVVIPLEAARWGALGTQHIAAAIELVQQHYNPRLRLMGYLVSRYKTRRSYQQTYLAELRKHFGDLAFETVIPDLAEYEKAVTDRNLLSNHSPSSRANKIANELLAEVQARAQKLA
ncbi:ParA family protein [Roseiconus nitratireducens]|uniref:ParA family protein n=1 Tax=Roseiconus nitratireducens TaxID=2605748 RepID=UPI0013759A78|nr:ParA family protein [Roseiconus nitratireducens]